MLNRFARCRELGISPLPGSVWTDPREQAGLPPPPIGFKPEFLPGPEALGAQPHSSYNGFQEKPPAALGIAAAPERGSDNSGAPSALPHYHYQGDNQVYPTPNKYETTVSVLPYGTPENTRYQRQNSTPNTKGSKSLPNSPVKRPTSSAAWNRDSTDSVGKIPNNAMGHQSMKRTQSIPETDPNLLDKKSADKKTKYHKGHMYQCVPDDPRRVEKETVL